jgi:hypothetical protein
VKEKGKTKPRHCSRYQQLFVERKRQNKSRHGCCQPADTDSFLVKAKGKIKTTSLWIPTAFI